MNNIAERLLNVIVAQLAVERDSITPVTKLHELCPDPLRMAELIVSVEEVFGIDIPDSEFERLHTVDDLLAYLKLSRPEAASR